MSSISIARNSIFGLIGPNGAGKTTFFNVLTGLYAPDCGDILFNGAPIAGRGPHAVAAAGIARTFQNIRLFANMTAIENAMVGRHVRTRAGVWGAVVRNAATRAEEAAIDPTREGAPRLRRHRQARRTRSRRISPTAISAGSRSPARSPPSHSCSPSTSRPPE